MASAVERRAAASSALPLEELAFDREVSSRATYLELAPVAADPLAGGIRAWVGHLTLARVISPDEARYRDARLAVAADATASVDEHVRRLLGPEREARPSADELARVAQPVADALSRLSERRREAARLLALEDEPEPALAETVLACTGPVFEASGRPESWLAALRRALATDAGEGWPAKISLRWLHEQLARGSMFEGVKLEAPRLPAPLGASSFALALHRLGAAWARADQPAHAPFCLTREPHDRLVARRAALLASLVLEPTFHQRKLGLGRDRAAAQARVMGRAAIAWLRWTALAQRSWQLAGLGDRASFAELSERALGRPLPRALLGVLPLPRRSAGLELRALLDALAEREQLRERFDEDWYDNPRAHVELRHEHHQPLAARRPLAPEQGSAALASRIDELLS